MSSAYCKIMGAMVTTQEELHIEKCTNCPYPDCIVGKKDVFGAEETDPIHRLANGEKRKECERRAQKALALKEEGYTPQEIANKLGYSRFTIARYLKK